MNAVIQSNINVIEVINKSANDIIPLLVASPNIEEELKYSVSKVFILLEKIIDLLPEVSIIGLNTIDSKIELEKSITHLHNAIKKLPECSNLLSYNWIEYKTRWNNYLNTITFGQLVIDFPISNN